MATTPQSHDTDVVQGPARTDTTRLGGGSGKQRFWQDRDSLAMVLLGLASGLPFVVFTGTIFLWFQNNQIDTSTAGILSWIGLAYAFKFLWSPTLHRSKSPITARLGLRRGWILPFQIICVICMAMFAFLDPREALPLIALAGLIGAVASASQDIAIDAWRIEIARDGAHLDRLSALYQFANRSTTIIGNAGALLFVNSIGWPVWFVVLSVLMALTLIGTMIAREPTRDASVTDLSDRSIQLGKHMAPYWRDAITLIVCLGWAWAIWTLGVFMYGALNGTSTMSNADFMLTRMPWILIATVGLPTVMAYGVWALDKSGAHKGADPTQVSRPWSGVTDTLYRFIVEPLVELVTRMPLAVPLILVLVLTYRFADAVWGTYAFWFYMGVDNAETAWMSELGALGHTNEEVAVASKLIGAGVTIFGAVIGALALTRFGRMPCLIAGAILAALTNLLFYDLAVRGPFVAGFVEFFQLDHIFVGARFQLDQAVVTFDDRLVRLIVAIAGENLAVGFASVVYVAYLSSIVNKRFAAIQYALLASLTMLVSVLVRPRLGDLAQGDVTMGAFLGGLADPFLGDATSMTGFPAVFLITFALGGVAVIASLLEAVRQSRVSRRNTSLQA